MEKLEQLETDCFGLFQIIRDKLEILELAYEIDGLAAFVKHKGRVYKIKLSVGKDENFS